MLLTGTDCRHFCRDRTALASELVPFHNTLGKIHRHPWFGISPLIEPGLVRGPVSMPPDSEVNKLSVFSWLMRAIVVDRDGQHMDAAFTVLHTAVMNEAGRKIAGGSLKWLSLWGLHGIATTLKIVYQYSI
jgi:hypothetical protein